MKHETQQHPNEMLAAIRVAYPDANRAAHSARPAPTAQPGDEIVDPANPHRVHRPSSVLPLFTVAQFAERNPAFTQAALRNLIFKADQRLSSEGVIPGNGLIEAGALIRVGRKVLLNEERFLVWVEEQSGVLK